MLIFCFSVPVKQGFVGKLSLSLRRGSLFLQNKKAVKLSIYSVPLPQSCTRATQFGTRTQEESHHQKMTALCRTKRQRHLHMF